MTEHEESKKWQSEINEETYKTNVTSQDGREQYKKPVPQQNHYWLNRNLELII